MDLIEILGYMMLSLLVLKLTIFIFGLLMLQYGRTIGLGVKYISDNGEFAVISGATGSIGREFTQEFASMGYNLILIALNGEKLDHLEQQLRKKYNTMKHIIKIATDLTKLESYELLRNRLAEVTPIVVLVNCVSRCPQPEKFWKCTTTNTTTTTSKQDLVMINVMAPVILMDILLPRFIQQNRGIVINVGAQCGDFRVPKYSTFSACKSFIHTLTEIIATECNGTNVFVQTVKPCITTNNMPSFQPSSFFRISSRLVAHSSLMTVGLESSHYGHWKHRFGAALFNTLIFIFGHRFTTFVIGLFMPAMMQTSATTTTIIGRDHKRQPSSTNLDLRSSSTSSVSLSPQSSPPLAIQDHLRCSFSEESDVLVDFDSKKYPPTPSPIVQIESDRVMRIESLKPMDHVKQDMPKQPPTITLLTKFTEVKTTNKINENLQSHDDDIIRTKQNNSLIAAESIKDSKVDKIKTELNKVTLN